MGPIPPALAAPLSSMQHCRRKFLAQAGERSLGAAHLVDIANDRFREAPRPARCPMKCKSVDHFRIRPVHHVSRRCELGRRPPAVTLAANDTQSPVAISALNWQRVIQNMDDAVVVGRGMLHEAQIATETVMAECSASVSLSHRHLRTERYHLRPDRFRPELLSIRGESCLDSQRDASHRSARIRFRFHAANASPR